jgi:hypothetical protein
LRERFGCSSPASAAGAAAFFLPPFAGVAGAASASAVRSTSSRIAISAASPRRAPSFMMRVYPPGRVEKRGPRVSNSFAMSVSSGTCFAA